MTAVEETQPIPRNAVKISYLYNMAPPKILTYDPPMLTTLRAYQPSDYGVLAVTTLIPAFMGWNTTRSFNSLYFKFGLSVGLMGGLTYSYFRSYARLTGLYIPTPYKTTEENK